MPTPTTTSAIPSPAGSSKSTWWQRFVEGSQCGVPNPILFIVGYFVVQAILLTITRNGASFDGAEQLITGQALEWGYGRSQPPLYTWMLVAIDQFVPGPLTAEHVLKAGLFIAGYAAIYGTALRIGLGRGAAALAMLATFLMPEIGWQAQTAYTHSTLVFATGALLLYVYFGLSARSSVWQHVLFGAVAASTLLSKFSAGFLILSMFAGSAFLGEFRAVFWRRRALAGLAVFLVLLAPHAVWSLNHLELLFALKGRFEFDEYTNPIVARAVGFVTYLSAVAIFVGPLVIAAGIASGWPWRLLRGWTPGERKLHVVFFAGLCLMALTPLLSGGSDFAPRWPLAAVFYYGIIAASFVDRVSPRRVAGFAAVCVIVALAFMVAINVRSSLPGSRSENDYVALLANIERRTGPIQSVVIADYPVLANLRVARPALRLVMDEFPFSTRFRDPRSVYLWTTEGGIPERLKAQMRAAGRDPDQMVWVEIPVSDTYGNRTSTLVRAAY